jgi:hypothetical protein
LVFQSCERVAELNPEAHKAIILANAKQWFKQTKPTLVQAEKNNHLPLPRTSPILYLIESKPKFLTLKPENCSS